MINLEKHEEVFTLTMDAGENRWNTTFVREIAKALDEVEASEGPAALITTSSSDKFYSNGLDLAWVQAPDEHPEAGDRVAFGDEFMKVMSRLITFPVPTIAAINGHAFGAGFMATLCHDVRVMRSGELRFRRSVSPADLSRGPGIVEDAQPTMMNWTK